MTNIDLYHLDTAIHLLMWQSISAAMAARINDGNGRGQTLEAHGRNMAAIAQEHLIPLYQQMTGLCWSFKAVKMQDLRTLESYYFSEANNVRE